MYLTAEQTCDVLVVGAGIAGISAALEAAEAGRYVILTSSTHIFSGSSFYPGTWGLGLIGPADDGDREDLAASICRVGCGMADPDMVRAFVWGIGPAIEKLRAMGVHLRRPAQGGEREYIPCFDHKHRDWNGIEGDSVRAVLPGRMEALGIQQRPNCELMELVKEGGRVCGAVFREGDRIVYIRSRALVLATGGYGGIFRYHLCTEDISGLGQSLALRAGCSLTNMEFMQMMSGYLSPAPRTVFNEKVFRFTRLRDAAGRPLLPETDETAALLAERSAHGPFTSRLSSRAVDLAIFQAFMADARGVTATYSEDMKRHPPEFVKTYFDWLLAEKGVSMDDPIHIGIFAHAANGGVRIDQEGWTGVSGLYACGEVTGGMHGADRIGGLSTANGLVFGGKAGRAAARDCTSTAEGPKHCEFAAWAVPDREQILYTLRDVMGRNAMIIRTGVGLAGAAGTVWDLLEGLDRQPADDPLAIVQSRRLEGRLITALCVLDAAFRRRESRGSHYREDFPAEDPAQASPSLMTMGDALRSILKER